MSSYLPGTPDQMVLAVERHRQLIEDARRYQERMASHQNAERPLRLRRSLQRFRNGVGELLVNWGQRLKVEVTDTVWG